MMMQDILRPRRRSPAPAHLRYVVANLDIHFLKNEAFVEHEDDSVII